MFASKRKVVRLISHGGASALCGLLLSCGSNASQQPCYNPITHANSVAYSPDGSFLAVGVQRDCQDNNGTLYNQGDTRLLATVSGNFGSDSLLGDGTEGVAFSPDGFRLASANDDRQVRLFDINLNLLGSLSGSGGGFWCAVFSPNGKLVAGGGQNNAVHIWDSASLKQLFVLTGHTNGVRSVAFSPDGNRLASAGGRDNSLRIWNPITGASVARLSSVTGPVWAVSYSPDGKTLISGEFKVVAVRDAVTGAVTTVLNGHTDEIQALAWSKDGRTLYTGGYDHRIIAWNTSDWSLNEFTFICYRRFCCKRRALFRCSSDDTPVGYRGFCR